ncbi:glycosyltransferase family 39 protein [Herbaspirillum sp. RTI4]|uniref:glycosyltransferase family 39 protein n=1 Tax=Herbaspirillum sp. RTI4 TaxID=3048640 RepID=UPI002AB5ACFA|nr:glycosyltransferase family 39 protein [Herbaspirillum sp. RTI4]MDY7577790.1 glycosyltransferase family 39 protein [Herbaspirillum sp. RTI4]MEA9980782.1 glycosyltransferase family 39 protein [Herbaspirillum sp. RTI4]
MPSLPKISSARTDRLHASWRARFSPDATSLVLLVLLLLAAHLLLWTLLTGISHRSPDLDNMEELVWGSVIEWGYYKHPPLPSWIIYGLTSVFGRSVWVTFFAGQLSVVLSLWMVWRLGCEMTSQKNALIATLLIMPITYYTTRGLISNHNTLQLWSIAGCIWMFYRSWRYERMRDWLGLGIFCGIALLSKYSVVVQFAVFFLFLLIDGRLRYARVWKGIALAAAPLLLMMLPHVLWLQRQVMTPVGYASESLTRESTRLENLEMVLDMLTTTLARLAPMLLALLVIVWWQRRRISAALATDAPAGRGIRLSESLRPEDRKFILLVGLGPLVLTLVAVLILKAPLIADWTTSYYMLFGFFAFWCLNADRPGTGKPTSSALLRICLTVIVTIQLCTVIGYALVRGPLSDMFGYATRANFPGEDISLAMQQEWRSHVNTPLTLVASDTWLGGNIAVHASRDVRVLIDGDVEKSQWVTAEQAASCGMLLALNRSDDAADGIPPKVEELMLQAKWRGTLQLPATRKMDGPQVIVEWGIIAPTAACRPGT